MDVIQAEMWKAYIMLDVWIKRAEGICNSFGIKSNIYSSNVSE